MYISHIDLFKIKNTARNKDIKKRDTDGLYCQGKVRNVKSSIPLNLLTKGFTPRPNHGSG